MTISVKRIYDPPVSADGVRILVDRLWPRGVSKEKAAIDAWMRSLAPSDGLRKWFHATPRNWDAFRRKYLKELQHPEAESDLQELYALAHEKKRLTLLFASKNEERNNATVLKELLEGMRKPPTGTGLAEARVARKRAVRKK